MVVLSSDPGVIMCQGFLKGLKHFSSNGWTFRHLEVVVGVEEFIRITHSRRYPTAAQIGSRIGVHPDEFEFELRQLIEYRYLHEMHPTFGPLIHTYKLGAVGGSIVRHMLPLDKFKPSGALFGGKAMELLTVPED